MKNKMLLGLGIISLSALLGACSPTGDSATGNTGSTGVTPVVPAVPVVGQSVEVQNLPTLIENVQTTAENLLSKDNPDIDPDVQAFWELFTPVQSGGMGKATTIGQQWLSQVIHSSVYKMGAQSALSSASIDKVVLLPTGTWENSGYNGTLVKVSELPTTGYVVKSPTKSLALTINWQVNGSPTTRVSNLSGYCDATSCYNIINEVPTNASGTLTKNGTVVAQGAMTLTPGGSCNLPSDIIALTSQVSVGRNAVKPAQASASYAWNASGISFQADASYRTKTQTASTGVKLAVNGNSGNRCDVKTMYFNPTGANLEATANLPGHNIASKMAITNLSNITISDAELKTQTPFQKITGSVDGNVVYNNNTVITAKGNLADGADADLNPGDQIVVSYIKDGKLVTTDMDGAGQDLENVLKNLK